MPGCPMPGCAAPRAATKNGPIDSASRTSTKIDPRELRAALVSCRQAIGPAPPRNGGWGRRRRATALALTDNTAPLRTRRSRSYRRWLASVAASR